MLTTNKIASRENAKLKHARKVRDGKEGDAIFVEGLRLCEEALRSDLTVRECFASTKFLKGERARILAAAVLGNGVAVNEINDALFKSIADTDNPQGIALICDRPRSGRKAFEARFQLSTENVPAVIFLEDTNNPSNLGAILRVAEAAGAAGVIVSENSADPFSAKAIRASMGSAFRVPIWHTASFAEALRWARERTLIVTAADIVGEKLYTQIDWKVPRFLVFGSEAHGLREREKKKVEDLIRIPMSATVESLNLAVSAGVILFEAKRQING
jgi:TrmH family RNA methyltransferase